MISIPRISTKHKFGQRFSSFYSSASVLSQDNKKRTVEKFANMKPVRQQATKPIKKAAVLIPLCIVDGQVSLLYTLRASNLKTHRGQVSFPGGMHDVSDANLEETALRETEEELGVNGNDVEIWGRGNVIFSRGTNVLPIIGEIKTELIVENLKINPREVEEVFTVALRDLCNPNFIGHTQFRNSYSVPVFLAGKRRIWGLTALITHLFLNALLPKKVYNHSVKFISQVKPSLPYRLL